MSKLIYVLTAPCVPSTVSTCLGHFQGTPTLMGRLGGRRGVMSLATFVTMYAAPLRGQLQVHDVGHFVFW